MKNKTIAIIGIISYVLTVLSSAQNEQGNYLSPQFLILIGGILTLIFVFFATKRLWKNHRKLSLIFMTSFLIRSVLESLLVSGALFDLSFLILFFNLIKIVYIISFITVIVKLFKK